MRLTDSLSEPRIRTAPFGQQNRAICAHPQQVLVVEDDSAMRCTVSRYFAAQRVPTSALGSRVELERYLAVREPTLIVPGRSEG